MPTATRILRALAEELDPTIRERNRREERQFARIMKVAPALLTFYQTDRISFTALAIAMKMAPQTLRRHFVDIPALLGHLIREHLREISAALAEIPWAAIDRMPRRRATYLAFTRKPFGAYTESHLLMLNNLPALPEDVRNPLIVLQDSIAASLAPPGQSEFVLSMLENPFMTPRRLEAIVATPEYAWHDATDPPAPLPATPTTLPPPGPAASIDLANIGGGKIPGGEVRIKRRCFPLDNFADAEPANRPALPPKPPPDPANAARSQAPPR